MDLLQPTRLRDVKRGLESGCATMLQYGENSEHPYHGVGLLDCDIIKTLSLDRFRSWFWCGRPLFGFPFYLVWGPSRCFQRKSSSIFLLCAQILSHLRTQKRGKSKAFSLDFVSLTGAVYDLEVVSSLSSYHCIPSPNHY